MKKILVLDNYDSFTYNLVHYVRTNPEYKVHVFRNDEISLDAVNSYDVIILSPGPGIPSEAGILKALINRYAPTKKILGVCLGMQAIGEVYGGNLVNLKNVFHGVATPIKVIDSADLLFRDLPKTFKIGRYHSWIVSKDNLPKELNITSVDDKGEIMSFKHLNYQLYGVQFHPESILTEYGKSIIDNFLAI